MSCKIIRNDNGIVEKVLAPNGESSKLYQDAVTITKNKEEALKLWAVAYIPGFKKWMSNLKPETTQQIKPGVEELFESNQDLANAVYEALGYKPYFNWKKELKHYHKEVPHTFKPGLTKLPNGKYLVKAFRTDDSGLGSK